MPIISIISGLILITAAACIGMTFTDNDDGHTAVKICSAFAYGQFFVWAVFELIAVPLVMLRAPFQVLVYVSVIFIGAAACLSFIRNKKRVKDLSGHKTESRPDAAWLLFGIAAALILFQMISYILGMHLDEDDSRWIAESNDALVYGTMFLRNPATGEPVNAFLGELSKDIASPYPMYMAVISQLLMVRPVVLYHTVYPPILLLLSYLFYYKIGCRLFRGSAERAIFFLMATVITQFFRGEGYTQASFSLLRIWQGKAVVAGVIIPALTYQLMRIYQEGSIRNWLTLAMIDCGACLLSGMGILLSAILIGIFGGYIVCRKRFREIPWLLVSAAPSVLFELVYYINAG